MFNLSDPELPAGDEIARIHEAVLDAGRAGRKRVVSRLVAVYLKLCGNTSIEVAQRLDVTRHTVIRWWRQYRRGGLSALQDARRGGKRSSLTESQLHRAASMLSLPPSACGLEGQSWHPRLLGLLIEREWGLTFSRRHLRDLFARLNGPRAVSPDDGANASGPGAIDDGVCASGPGAIARDGVCASGPGAIARDKGRSTEG